VTSSASISVRGVITFARILFRELEYTLDEICVLRLKHAAFLALFDDDAKLLGRVNALFVGRRLFAETRAAPGWPTS
jgi:hypothetical protein